MEATTIGRPCQSDKFSSHYASFTPRAAPLSLSLCRVCGSSIDFEFDGKLKKLLGAECRLISTNPADRLPRRARNRLLRLLALENDKCCFSFK